MGKVERALQLLHHLRLMFPNLTVKELDRVREELSITLASAIVESENRPKPNLVLVREDMSGGSDDDVVVDSE